MLAFVRTSCIQNCILIVSRNSRRLYAIFKANLCIIDGIGEGGCCTGLYAHLFMIQLEDVALADADAVIVEVAKGI